MFNQRARISYDGRAADVLEEEDAVGGGGVEADAGGAVVAHLGDELHGEAREGRRGVGVRGREARDDGRELRVEPLKERR